MVFMIIIHTGLSRLTVPSICTEGQQAKTSIPSSPWGSSESCGLSRPLNACPSWRYSNTICHSPRSFWEKKKRVVLNGDSHTHYHETNTVTAYQDNKAESDLKLCFAWTIWAVWPLGHSGLWKDTYLHICCKYLLPLLEQFCALRYRHSYRR